MSFRLALAMTVSVALTAGVFIAVAGPLNPPSGPVASSYKTLGEIEPRTAISAVSTPGDAGSVFRIRQSGTYYLTADVYGVSGKSGIIIAASNVTLDLNGFGLYGATGADRGVGLSGSQGGLVISNGSVRGWPGGGVAVGSAYDSKVAEIYATANGGTSVGVGANSEVRDCRISIATANAVSVGVGSHVIDCLVEGGDTGVVLTGRGCTVERCKFISLSGSVISGQAQSTVRFCAAQSAGGGITVLARSVVEGCTLVQTGTGVTAGDGSRVIDCTVDLVATGFSAGSDCILTGCIATRASGDGFAVNSRCVLTGCVATLCSGDGFQGVDGNDFSGCRAEDNDGDGFRVQFGSTIRRCAARLNMLDGIESAAGGHLLENESDSNGNGGTGANIRLTGYGCRVEGNTLIGGDFGIQATAGGNLIVRNSSAACPNHYGSIAAGNDVGPVGSAATSASPWANVQY
ncbi:MAG: right-handed parallel beta-helix repeat-containing protein [Phycisphaerales bacterium]|nr:right-handed parallel beta-helix repeat-containing protein [Phycisphaerales bacterium]